MELAEPIDEIHRLSVYATAALSEDFAKLKARVAAWQPEPCPPIVPELPYDPHIPYLDEIPMKRRWFR